MKKILIVEDDQFIRELYERQVKLAGFNVESLEKGKDALEKLKEEPFDLVMLDINMPDVNGFDILRFINKEIEKKPAILILSNVAQQKNIDKALKEGAQAFIIKSTYTPDQVVREVKSLLT